MLQLHVRLAEPPGSSNSDTENMAPLPTPEVIQAIREMNKGVTMLKAGRRVSKE